VSKLLPERLTETPEGEVNKNNMRKVTKWPIQSKATCVTGQNIPASWQFKGTLWQDYDTQFWMQTAAANHPHLAVADTSHSRIKREGAWSQATQDVRQ